MKKIILLFVRIITHLYPMWLKGKLKHVYAAVYNCWIRHYIGHVGEKSSIGMDCQLQGGGSMNISIGDRTGLGKHVILGCWKCYRNKDYTPRIEIGNDKNIVDNAWIGDKASILFGVTNGED